MLVKSIWLRLPLKKRVDGFSGPYAKASGVQNPGEATHLSKITVLIKERIINRENFSKTVRTQQRSLGEI